MTANRISGKRRGNSGHGFTLIELIVVIVIIAIIAAVGLTTALGYIKKSRFEQNSQSAVSVYQAAQTALSMKVANGTNDSWTKKLVEMQLNADQITALTKDLDTDNESQSVVLALTFNPKSASSTEDSYLYNLLNDQFYDKTIFSGTISVEFNVVASYAKGRIYYSSWVASAFYCSQNDADTKWSDVCIGNSTDDLPQREPYEYRRDTSLVGWYNGTPDSVTGPDGVCPVHIPKTVVNDLDGHIIADSTDTGYLFNLRNGETLDVSWAIFDYDDTYRSISNLDIHDEDITINLITEGTNRGNSESYDKVELYISQANLKKFRDAALNSTETITYENINSKTNITRVTRSALVDVQVKRGLTAGTWKFPMTITLVTGDDRIGCPDKDIGYYEYRLSLDCMMNRQSETEAVNSRFNAERLFGTTPRNISATLTATFTHYLAKDQTESKSVNDVAAARAIDDPVYYTGLSSVQGKTSYCYMVVEEAAAYDGEDDNTEKITGKCVVNTLFGDLKYSESLAATSWSSSGGNAVITSFRHLYNIRWIQAGTVKYTIVRDLNWYINNPGTLLVSDVKVFKKNGEFCSPSFTTNDETTKNKLHIVSFPALKELKSDQTLTSASSGGKKFSINNLQMRADSFRNNTDLGYGLICSNNGTVSNIYTNNFNLVLVNVADGTESDYDLISKDGSITISPDGSSQLNGAYFVGGLVGTNHGNIGNSGAQANENIVMMSNAIILTSPKQNDYWKAGKYKGVSGIIGSNDGKITGTIEINGRFAVVGNCEVGAAIAYSKTDIGARIVVDGNGQGASEFTLPVEETTGSDENLSCVVVGTDYVGGAIGELSSCELEYDVAGFDEDDISYDSDGRINFSTRSADDYQLYVNLPEDSLLLEMSPSTDWRYIGGAIGIMRTCKGDYNFMSLYVCNDGNILIRNNSANRNAVGGAVGHDKQSTISTVYITAINGKGALGSLIDNNNVPKNKPEYTGGVYGLVDGTGSRTLVMDVENNGTISSVRADNNEGAGGAIGALNNCGFKVIANIVNKEDCKIISSNNTASDKSVGAGGAIGSMSGNNSSLAAGSHIFVENQGSVYSKYNAGGAVGVMLVNRGEIFTYNEGATINGDNCIGGAVGWIRNEDYGKIQSILYDSTVKGIDFIGGAAGRIVNLQDSASAKTIVYGSDSIVAGTGSVIGGVCGDVRVQGTGSGARLILEGDSSLSTLTVTAGSNGVGGVAGLMRSNIANAAQVIGPDQSDNNQLILNVNGVTAVGGAIGKLRSTGVDESGSATSSTTALLNDNLASSNINVDISIVLYPGSSIIGSGNEVGGAVGYIHASGGQLGGSISVKSSSGEAADSYIRGVANVGGAVGHVRYTAPYKAKDGSGISVDFSASPFIIEALTGKDSNANLGGAVGYFEGDPNGNSGNENTGSPINVDLGNSSVISEGSNVGGGIGNNYIKIGDVTVSLNGTVSGNSHIAGGIGHNRITIKSIAVDANDADISGSGDCVGGAVGLDEKNITSASADLGEDTSVVGQNYVAGAIGRIANQGATVTTISVVIGSDSSISGIKYLGGAVGSMGTGSNSANAGTIKVEINTGIPIIQDESVSKSVDACIGGAVGEVVNGTITSIEFSGSGGDINPQSDVSGSGAPYYPISNGVLIYGSGKSIGGIVGLIGDITTERSVQIKSISVADDGPSLAVVSDNGAQGIGGWIGTCYSKAVIGNAKASLSSLSIKTVKVVYSRGECVGGFIGYVGKTPTNAANKVELYVNIDMELSSAYICGLARTGGVYGDSNCVNHYGKCNLDICNNTSIGDYKGDIETDDLSGCFCIEAGGFAGRFSNRSIFYGSNDKALCEITITIDETSRIFAGGTSAPSDCEVTIDDAGVGGAIGRLGGVKGGNSEISVTNTTAEKIQDHFVKTFGVIASSSKPVVYSAHSHAGGAIGHMLSGCLARAFTTACVKQVGSGYTGGFVGKMDEGSIRNCYVGGHTFGGQYVPDEENIVGTQYVGGFVGYVTKDISIIYQSYSTASVRSTYIGGKNVYLGGFIGGSDPALTVEKFQYTYCTGLVTAPNNLYTDGIIPSDGSVYVGAYAGYLSSLNICKSGEASGRALMYINQYSEMGRVGNYDEKSFYDGEFVASTDPNKEAGVKNRNDNSKHVLLARWGSWGPNWYIRHKKLSVYEAQPFDTYLVENSDNYFPLRTFISYITPNVSNSWTGEHWGDWPVFPEDKIMLDKDNAVITINMPQEGFVFNGSQVTLEDYLEVKYNGQELDLDTDYALKYSDNDKIGTATVRITAIGKYYGSFVRQFEIVQADISNQNSFTIAVKDNLPYADDNEVKTEVTVLYQYKEKVTTLVENKDYTLLYENNIQPGVATVKITGIGNYKGEVVKEYTILPLFDIFFSTGEGTTIPQQRIISGGTAVKPQVDPTRTGHSFGGWYADENCEAEYNFSNPVTENITIYAKWIPEQYEVTFEVNGGVAVNPMSVEYGNTIDAAIIPEQIKEAYTFMGWYTDELCTEEFDLDTAITGALKLYARWEKTPIVTFDTNGGSNIDNVMIERYNGCVTKPEDPTMEGYTFLGWCSDEECNNEYDFDTQLTADITLYAKWGKNPTVTFYIDADNIVPVTIAYGAKASSAVPEIPEKDGWTPISPLKWYTDLDANIVYDMDAEVTEDVTIYLGWLKTWKFTFHTGDGATVYGENGVLVIIHGRRLPDVLDPVEPVREGYKFIGWYTDPDFTNHYNDWGATYDTVLYAKWEKDPDAT